MDTQTAVLVGLDELNHIIDRLHGRVLSHQARITRHPVSSLDRKRGEQALKNMQIALNRMRALREAMMIGAPTGLLH